jgi:predicted DNA-binding transcriptional regulator AlpA
LPRPDERRMLERQNPISTSRDEVPGLTVSELIAAIAGLDPADMPAVLAAVAARLAEAREVPVAESPADDGLLDAEAAAKFLGVSESWLYHRPKLPFRVKVGGKLKFRRSSIERWLKQMQS